MPRDVHGKPQAPVGGKPADTQKPEGVEPAAKAPEARKPAERKRH